MISIKKIMLNFGNAVIIFFILLFAIIFSFLQRLLNLIIQLFLTIGIVFMRIFGRMLRVLIEGFLVSSVQVLDKSKLRSLKDWLLYIVRIFFVLTLISIIGSMIKLSYSNSITNLWILLLLDTINLLLSISLASYISVKISEKYKILA